MAVADSQSSGCLRGLYDGIVVEPQELQVIKNLGDGPSGATELAW
jgi:hypothetical protein